VQLETVTVARIELIGNLLVDAGWRETQAARSGQLLGSCIHHASVIPSLFLMIFSVLAIPITMVVTPLGALLIAAAGQPLLLSPSDLHARSRTVFLSSLAASADRKRRATQLALTLDPFHFPSLQRAGRKLAFSPSVWASCQRLV
jgi:hypothetical protein